MRAHGEERPAVREGRAPEGVESEGDQVERYLTPAVRGEKMDALAMTEPDAGSDVRGMSTTARREGGEWGLREFLEVKAVSGWPAPTSR